MPTMASVGDESYDSLPSAQRVALDLEKQRLLQVCIPKYPCLCDLLTTHATT